jgi:hypothetical protein
VAGLLPFLSSELKDEARPERDPDCSTAASHFGSLHRPGGNPPHAQTVRPEVKLLKHLLSSYRRRVASGTFALIYLALPFICAHWAILPRWAEPHYLASYGLMPARHGGSLQAQGLRELEACAFFFD